MAGSESLYDKDIISDIDIENRLGWLAFLDDPELSDADRELWTDEIEELAELNQLTEAGTEHGGLISENYWESYAHDDADEVFGLRESGADRYFAYGGYEKYADDLQTDYSQVEFHGTTYYYQ